MQVAHSSRRWVGLPVGTVVVFPEPSPLVLLELAAGGELVLSRLAT
jgi:hypothetical protein